MSAADGRPLGTAAAAAAAAAVTMTAATMSRLSTPLFSAGSYPLPHPPLCQPILNHIHTATSRAHVTLQLFSSPVAASKTAATLAQLQALAGMIEAATPPPSSRSHTVLTAPPPQSASTSAASQLVQRSHAADDPSQDPESEERPAQPLVLFLTRRNVKQLFKAVPLPDSVRQLLLQLRVNGALRPLRHRTALTPLDPARLRGSQTRHSHCCKLTVQDPPCLDGLELTGWSVLHAGNRSLLIMKTVLIASDTFDTSDDDGAAAAADGDDGDEPKRALPASAAAKPPAAAGTPVAAAVAVRLAPNATAATAVQTQPTSPAPAKQAVRSAASRPLPAPAVTATVATPARSTLPPAAPKPQLGSNTHSVQRVSAALLLPNQQQQQRLHPLRSQLAHPQQQQQQQPPLQTPPPYVATGKVTVIVSERLTIPVKAMAQLFPEVSYPAPAYLRIQQNDTLGLAHLPVTIAPGPHFKPGSSRTYVVEGLDAGPLRERHAPKGKFSVERLVLLLTVGDPPAGTSTPGDAIAGMAKHACSPPLGGDPLTLSVGDVIHRGGLSGETTHAERPVTTPPTLHPQADLSVAVEHHRAAWEQHLEGGRGSVRVNPAENAFLIRAGLPPPGHNPSRASPPNAPLATPSAPPAAACDPRPAAPAPQRQAAPAAAGGVGAAKPPTAAGGASRAAPHMATATASRGPPPAALATPAAAPAAVAAPARPAAAPVTGAVTPARPAATVTLPSQPAGQVQSAAVRQATPPALATAVTARIPSTPRQASPPKQKALPTPSTAAAAAAAAAAPRIKTAPKQQSARETSPPGPPLPAAPRQPIQAGTAAAGVSVAGLPPRQQQAPPPSTEQGAPAAAAAAAAEVVPAKARKPGTPRSKDGIIRSKVSVPMAFAMLHFPRQLVWPLAVALRVCVSGAFDPVEYAVMCVFPTRAPVASALMHSMSARAASWLCTGMGDSRQRCHRRRPWDRAKRAVTAACDSPLSACAFLQVQKNKNSYYLTQQPSVIIGKKLVRLQFRGKQIILHLEDPTAVQAGGTAGPAGSVADEAAAAAPDTAGEGATSACSVGQRHPSLPGPIVVQQQKKRRGKAAADLAVDRTPDSGASGDSSHLMTHQASHHDPLASAPARKAKACKASSPSLAAAAAAAAAGRVALQRQEGAADGTGGDEELTVEEEMGAAKRERRAKRRRDNDEAAGLGLRGADSQIPDERVIEHGDRAAAAAAEPCLLRAVPCDIRGGKASKRAGSSDVAPAAKHRQPASPAAGCGLPRSGPQQAMKQEAGASAGGGGAAAAGGALRALRDLRRGGSFMAVTHPMLQVLWGAGKLRMCRQLLLDALGLDGSALPKAGRRGEAAPGGGLQPELVTMGVLVVAVMQVRERVAVAPPLEPAVTGRAGRAQVVRNRKQSGSAASPRPASGRGRGLVWGWALDSLSLRASVMSQHMMRAHSALAGLEGSSSVFACSAGHSLAAGETGGSFTSREWASAVPVAFTANTTDTAAAAAAAASRSTCTTYGGGPNAGEHRRTPARQLAASATGLARELRMQQARYGAWCPMLKMMSRVTRAEHRRLEEDVEELARAVESLKVGWVLGKAGGKGRDNRLIGRPRWKSREAPSGHTLGSVYDTRPHHLHPKPDPHTSSTHPASGIAAQVHGGEGSAPSGKTVHVPGL
ncbi:MAG: hypothetical protein WDW36_007138 [Sanguina aurantia]